MKTTILSLILLTATCFIIGCSECEEIISEPCGLEPIPNTDLCGWTVFTCFARGNDGNIDPDDHVGILLDTRYNSMAPRGENWMGTLISNIPSNWTVGELGQIFGIAIDRNENIFLASSDIYGMDGNSNTPVSTAQIFKCPPPNFAAVQFTSLPNSGGRLNGIGNLCFEKWNNQLFATNLEDGMIYRIDIISGNILETFDPFNSDNNTPGLVSIGEQLWGIGSNYEGRKVKVYFARQNEIHSIELDDTGAFVTTSSKIELSDLKIGNRDGQVISDISFSGDNSKMIIAERGDPHNSRVLGFELQGTTWLESSRYYVGSPIGETEGDNCAGGVDFFYNEKDKNVSDECDISFFSSGNYMKTSVSGLEYGIEGISWEGNNSSEFMPSSEANSSTDIFIGLGVSKNLLGDVEVFDCTECIDPCKLNQYVN